jgi:hypothetical protein
MPLFLKKEEESSPLLSPSFIPYDIQQPASRMYGKGHCYNNLFLKPNTSYMIYYKIPFKYFFISPFSSVFSEMKGSAPYYSSSFISMTEYKLCDIYNIKQSLLLILFLPLSVNVIVRVYLIMCTT